MAARASVYTRRSFSALAALSALSACAPRRDEPATGLTRLRIGHQKNGVLLLAKSRGVFEKTLDGVSVEWSEFTSGPPLLEALAAGAVDLGATGDSPPLFAQAAGAPLRYVAVQPLTGQSEAILTPRGSTIQRLEDLRGKRIGLTKGSSSHLLVVKALKLAGLSLSDVRPSFLSPADAASAFSAGALDAWATWDPYLALAQRDQGARVLTDGSKTARSDAFVLASARLVDTAPAALGKVLDALRVEAAWGEAHRPELVRIVSQANGLPPEIVETGLRRGKLAVEPVTAEVVARQQGSADIFANLGVIPRAVRVADVAWTGWTPR